MMQLRYTGPLGIGLFVVFLLLAVLQSFVVGRAFQLTTAGAGSQAAVVNLSGGNALPNQLSLSAEKASQLHAPPLPEDLQVARVQPPDVATPSMSLPPFKPPFAAAAGEAVAETPAENPGNAAPAAGTAPAAQPVLAVGDIVLVDRVEPRFPAQAIREGISSGSVTIKFTVDTDGSVLNPVVTDAKPRRGIFDDAALRAVRNWKFKPLSAPRDTSVIVDFNQGGG